MESIERLREYINGTTISTWTRNYIDQHIDAIEREVEDNARFRAEAEPFHDRLCEAAEAREDVTLWGVDYTALPVDADGEPIHVGDVMWGPFGKAIGPVWATAGNVVMFEHDFKGGYSQVECFDADVLRHHRAPTVEDVLAEFVAKLIERNELTTGAAQTIAEYAKRLTLAGDE